VLGEVRRNEEGTLLALLAGHLRTGRWPRRRATAGFPIVMPGAWCVPGRSVSTAAWSTWCAAAVSTLAALGIAPGPSDARLKSRFAAQLAAATEEVAAGP